MEFTIHREGRKEELMQALYTVLSNEKLRPEDYRGFFRPLKRLTLPEIKAISVTAATLNDYEHIMQGLHLIGTRLLRSSELDISLGPMKMDIQGQGKGIESRIEQDIIIGSERISSSAITHPEVQYLFRQGEDSIYLPAEMHKPEDIISQYKTEFKVYIRNIQGIGEQEAS